MSQAPSNAGLFERWLLELGRHYPGIALPGRSFSTVDELVSWAGAGGADRTVLLQTFALAIGAAWLDELGTFHPSAQFVSWYPISLARRTRILAGEPAGGKLPVVVGDFEGLHQLDHLRRHFGLQLELMFSPADVVLSAINEAWQQRTSETQSTIDLLDRDQSVAEMRIAAGGEDLLAASEKSPIVRLTNSLIFDAIRSRASDIHIQPYAGHLQVRFRIDGVLFDQFQIPRESQEEVLSRIKVMGKMNIAEKRFPQDGRATVSLGDREIDLRIASLPTSYGERIVLRLLDKGVRLYTLEELGMTERNLDQFRRLIHREHGMFLVTGPTGAGKSTTLYAALQELNVTDKNVVTLEDPIEYQLHGISQTQINEKKKLTFASGLRNVLRQDPDIIMIGEIRDQETAEMAIQSALTGHMVYSTLHTNDASSAVTRLLDLGIEPYLVASSLTGVLAQRLVRRICPHCRVEICAEHQAEEIVAHTADQKPVRQWKGQGCDNCRGTGYLGRVGIFEMMSVDDRIRSLIQSRANASDIRRAAMSAGMKLLYNDGIAKVARGTTTLEEVLRVTMDAQEVPAA
jgi:general secretion pathway protein E